VDNRMKDTRRIVSENGQHGKSEDVARAPTELERQVATILVFGKLVEDLPAAVIVEKARFIAKWIENREATLLAQVRAEERRKVLDEIAKR